MKAIVQESYGPSDVLKLADVDTPVVGDGDVLVRARAASLQAGDLHFMRGLPYILRVMGFGLLRPKNRVAGFDVAGTVEAVGGNVATLSPGDEVFGWCNGAFAEHACAAEGNFAPKPANLTFEQAAAVPGSATAALQGLRDGGGIQPEQKVLVNGASGGVGTFAVQIAASYGAEVTGVCSTANLEMIRAIGADHVVDYTKHDFTQGVQRYDLIVDIAADHAVSEFRRALTPDGTLVLIGDTGGRWVGGLPRLLGALALSPFVSQSLRPFVAKGKNEDLVHLKDLVEAGKVTPVIDGVYPLSAVPEAVRHLEDGHPRGKIVVGL